MADVAGSIAGGAVGVHSRVGLGDRVGVGRDRHPFGPGSPLQLGGVAIEGAPRLHGHSDGDVLLHALADALLGAAALGDLGRLAPADARTPKGVAGEALVLAALRGVRDAGWEPAAIDATVIGARPRLGDQLEAMRSRISELLRLDVGAVSVKASTGNLQGPEGEGRAIAAEVVATLRVGDR